MNNIITSAIVAVVVGLVTVTTVLSIQPAPAPSEPLAATSQQVTDGGCYFLGGLHTCPVRKALTTATTTVCSIKSPAATSTLDRARITLTVSSTTASTVTIAKGATFNASSTLLASAPLAADAQGTLTASSTATGVNLDNINIIAPNQYINFSMSGGNGTFSPSGSCFAEFTY